MSGKSRQQPKQTAKQVKVPSNPCDPNDNEFEFTEWDEPGFWDGENFPEYAKAIKGLFFYLSPCPKTLEELNKYDARHFIDPSKMAERKEVTDARVEGFIEGESSGVKKGFGVGLACAAVFAILVWTIGKVVS